MARSRFGKLTLVLGTTFALTGCQSGTQPFGFLKDKPANAATATAAASIPVQESSVKLVDRDVEAPDVFQVKEKGLWDGRPSLGGVWVAYPNVNDPERVIIRNPANGKFVIGALFRRERNNPGPKLQLSSDAASALGLLAGQPATVSVTALRRQEAPQPAPKLDAKKPILDTNQSIEAKPIGTLAASASAAIDKGMAGKVTAGKATAGKAATAKPVKATALPGATPAATKSAAPAMTAASATPSSDKSYLQIGIFSVEANAQRAAKTLKKAGVGSIVTKDETHGKTYWRVDVGPIAPAAHDALLAKVKKLGFADAYYSSK
jgi:rare lipoprotein A